MNNCPKCGSYDVIHDDSGLYCCNCYNTFKKKEEDIEMSKVFNLEFPTTDVVGCKFVYKTEGNRDENLCKTGKTYYYKVLPGVGEIKVGDSVVVNCATGMQVVEVTEINCIVSDTLEATFNANWSYVVGKVDLTAFITHQENEKKKEYLSRQLIKKKKELEGLLAYEILAEKSPEFKEMLEAFKALGGTIK